MFFILSKLLHFLLTPITWILVTLIWGIKTKRPKRKKRLLWSCAIMLLVFTNPLLMNTWMKAWEVDPVAFDKIQKHDIAVVLTGVTNLNKRPVDRVYFNKGADRVYHALLLYNKKKVDKILITGGNLAFTKDDKMLREADQLKTFFLNAGVPEHDLIIENQAKNTHENALFTKQKLDTLGLKNQKLILVTSAFHMRRSQACFDKAGLTTTAFPGDYWSFDEYGWQIIIPSANWLHVPGIIFHEWFGILTYKMMGYI